MLLYLIIATLRICKCGWIPSVYTATDFTKEQYAGVYKLFYDFANRYYGIDYLLAGSVVSPAAFKSHDPIHIFDVSNEWTIDRCCRSHCEEGI